MVHQDARALRVVSELSWEVMPVTALESGGGEGDETAAATDLALAREGLSPLPWVGISALGSAQS